MEQKRIVIYLSNEEYKIIKEIAKIHGLPSSTYVKLMGLRRYLGDSASGPKLYNMKLQSLKDNLSLNITTQKNKQITIYLNQNEHSFIKKMSNEQGLSMSNYLKIVGTGRFVGLHKDGRILKRQIEKDLIKKYGDFKEPSIKKY